MMPRAPLDRRLSGPAEAGGRLRRRPRRALGARLAATLAVAGILTCDGGTEPPANQAPRAVGTIPDQVVEVDSATAVDVTAYFVDPDGDALTYSAVSSSEANATVTMAGSTVTARGVAAGNAMVTVTARDPGGLTAAQTFAVMIPNRTPVVVGRIDDLEVFVDSVAEIDVAQYFTDPDGDELAYQAASSDTTLAALAVSGSVVTVTGVAVGSVTVTVTAQDTAGLSAEQSFGVTVPNRSPKAVGTIADREVEVDSVEVVDVAEYFTDPDRQELEYSAASSDTTRVTLTVSGSVLTIAGAAAGNAAVTVTATDPGGLSAEQSFVVTVPNRPPHTVGTIADRDLFVGDTIELDAAQHFSDPDGDTLAYAATSSDSSFTAVRVTGSAVTLTGMAVGSATVTVTAADPEGLAAEQEFTVTVPNRPPEAVGTLADREVFVGDSVTVDVAANFFEPDGQELEYAAAGTRPAKATVAVSGSAVTISGVAVGATTVTVTAQDPGGLRAEHDFVVTVPNRAPETVGSIGDREVEVDGVVTLGVAAYFRDLDGQALNYSASSSDTVRVVVIASRGVVTVLGVRAGHAIVTVVATDSGGLTAEQSFSVRVPNRPPRPVGRIADRNVYVGDTIEIDVAAHFRDPDQDTLAYTATSQDSTLVAVSASGSAVSLAGMAVGNVTVMVVATDPEGLSAEQRFTVSVPNRAPETVGTVADQQVFIGDSVTLDVAANFAEPDGQELEYAVATLNAAVVSVAVSGSAVTATGVALGSATVTVTARDPGGLEAVQRFVVMVPNRAPEAVGAIADREIQAGSSAEVDVSAYFADPDGDALEYSARSSDTTRVRASVLGRLVTLHGVAGGTATVTVTARDPGGLSARQSFVVTVPNRAPTTVGSIDDRSVPRGRSLSLDIAPYFADPDGDDLTYTIASSDPGTAGVSVSGSMITIRGVSVGVATVTVTARDPGGLTSRQRFDVTVVRPNRAPRAVGTIPDQTLAADEEHRIDVSGYFTDPDDDALDYSATSSDRSVASVAVSNDAITLTGEAEGTATITVTATDPGGLTAVQPFKVQVAPNRPPVVIRRIEDLTALVGERYSLPLDTVFEDPDGDPLTYAASSSNTAVAEPEVIDDTMFVSLVGVGSATMEVTATDPGGLSATETFQVTAVLPGNFDLWMGFTDAVTEARRVWFRRARSAWSGILDRTELTDVAVPDPVRCLGLTASGVGTVDDHLLLVHVDEIDGPGGTLAFAGYCYTRSLDGSPVVSATIVDEADIGRLVSLGMLGVVAFHEFAHGLGFHNAYWRHHGLLDAGDDPHFDGALAVDAFDAAGGAGYPGAKVPISPDYSHWREDVLGREGMTPALTLGAVNPFSAITLQAMADVGYLVDVSLADDYQLPNTVPPEMAGDLVGQALDLSNDVVQGPVMVIDEDGRVVRVISAPPGSPALSFNRHEVRIERRNPSRARDGGLSLVRPAREPIWRLVRPAPRRSPP